MSEFEEYLSVEAGPNEASLMFKDEKQQARFELGVSMLVYSWDALDIAVVNQWGGVESGDKRDWITGVIVDLFKDNKVMDSPVIEETLLYAMLDEFDTHVDDGTAHPVADNMIRLYEECRQQDYSRVESLYTKWLEKQKIGPSKDRIVHVNDDGSSGDEEDDDEEEEDCSDEGMDVDMEHDIPVLVEKSEPIVDDDGFELVQKKGRRKH